MEGSAVVPAVRFSPYAAAVCFNDSPAQVEPQAESVNSLFDGSRRSAITPKQACHLVGCEPNAMVAHGDMQRASFTADANLNRRLRWGVLEGIAQQVPDHTFGELSIQMAARVQVFGNVELDSASATGVQSFHRLSNELLQFYVCALHFQASERKA